MEALTEVELCLFRKEIFTACELKFWVQYLRLKFLNGLTYLEQFVLVGAVSHEKSHWFCLGGEMYLQSLCSWCVLASMR